MNEHGQQPTREELRDKLRNKIKNKRNVRVNASGLNRNKANKLNDKLKTVYSIVEKYATDNTIKAGDLPEELVTEVMNVMEKEDITEMIKHLVSQAGGNTNFSELLEKLSMYYDTE